MLDDHLESISWWGHSASIRDLHRSGGLESTRIKGFRPSVPILYAGSTLHRQVKQFRWCR